MTGIDFNLMRKWLHVYFDGTSLDISRDNGMFGCQRQGSFLRRRTEKIRLRGLLETSCISTPPRLLAHKCCNDNSSRRYPFNSYLPSFSAFICNCL